jgi:predicted DNA-binding transcriptional regulator YafY
MKSERLLALLLALQRDGKRSAPELAELLEVSQRTIYRDIDALAVAGVPVHAERGAGGGIVLADSYRDALGRFDEGELAALFVSSDDVLADVGLIGRRGSALRKIAKALPVRERAKLERGRGRVHIDARRWIHAPASSAVLMALRDAIFADRRVSIAYTDRAGAHTERTVEPLGLVAKAGVWYLAASDRAIVKTFRVQRIIEVRLTDEAFRRPPNFDLAAYWESVAGTMAEKPKPFRATIVMTDRALASAQAYLDVTSYRAIDGSEPRKWEVEVDFYSAEAAVFETIGWNEDAHVIRPAELRDRLAARARELVKRYGRGTRSARSITQ